MLSAAVQTWTLSPNGVHICIAESGIAGAVDGMPSEISFPCVHNSRNGMAWHPQSNFFESTPSGSVTEKVVGLG